MNFLIYLVNEGLSKFLPFITILIVAKYIDVESFGQLTLYYITLEILTIVINNNIRATTRIDFFQSSKERYIETKSAHNIGSFFLLIFVLVICFFVDIIEYKYMLLLALTAFMRGLAYFVLSNLQCQENAKLYGVYNIIPIALSSLIFLSAILYGYGIESWFYSIFVATLVQFLFIVRYVSNNKLFQISSIYNYRDIYNEFKHGLIFMPQAIGFLVNGATDRLFISMILGNVIVGYYMFVFQLATPIIIFSTVINLYLTPKINRYLKTKDIEHIKKILFKFTILIFLFASINYVAIEFVINYFYYDKYTNSLEYIPYIVIALFLQATYLIYMNIFYYIGKKTFISMLVLILAFVKVIVIFASLSLFKMEGLLIANIILDGLILLFVLVKINKSLKKIGERK